MPPLPFPDDGNPYNPDISNGKISDNNVRVPSHGAGIEQNRISDIDVMPDRGERFDRAR
ncbi:MAG: hypothetical protein F6K16_41560, partial [Symploca sp. SIO2B6]|nr:hypothetical protein [Symploca sp. SIO2B6]